MCFYRECFFLALASIPLCGNSSSETATQVQTETQKKLQIVEIGDPVLRQEARPLTVKEVLSPEIQELIQDMKNTMKGSGVGLAAPQVGKSLQLIVIEDMDHSFLTPEQLVERDRYKVPFHVVINPRIYLEGEERALFFEGCISVPGYRGVVPRAKSVRVECLNERGEPVVIQAHGWYARILQHEIDHLSGILYIDRVLLRSLMTEETYRKLWKDKSINEILDAFGAQYENNSNKPLS